MQSNTEWSRPNTSKFFETNNTRRGQNTTGGQAKTKLVEAKNRRHGCDVIMTPSQVFNRKWLLLLAKNDIGFDSLSRYLNFDFQKMLVNALITSMYWLLCSSSHRISTLLLTFKCLHGLAPHCLTDLVRIARPFRQLRNSSKLFLKKAIIKNAFVEIDACQSSSWLAEYFAWKLEAGWQFDYF